MGKIFISPTLAWVIPDSGEKPIKVIFDPPKWQVEEQDDEKRLVFSRKLTEEELAELKTELGINPEGRLAITSRRISSPLSSPRNKSRIRMSGSLDSFASS